MKHEWKAVIEDTLLQRGVPYELVVKVTAALEPEAIVIHKDATRQWLRARNPRPRSFNEAPDPAQPPMYKAVLQADSELLNWILGRLREQTLTLERPPTF